MIHREGKGHSRQKERHGQRWCSDKRGTTGHCGCGRVNKGAWNKMRINRGKLALRTVLGQKSVSCILKGMERYWKILSRAAAWFYLCTENMLPWKYCRETDQKQGWAERRPLSRPGEKPGEHGQAWLVVEMESWGITLRRRRETVTQISGLHDKVAHRAIYSNKECWKRNQHLSCFFPL